MSVEMRKIVVKGPGRGDSTVAEGYLANRQWYYKHGEPIEQGGRYVDAILNPGITRDDIDRDGYYTIWQRVGGHWVIERSYPGRFILDTMMDEIEKSWKTTRPYAAFPHSEDPNQMRENPYYPEKPYVLQQVIVIDHPELRGAGMTRPAPGSTQLVEWRFLTQKEALSEYNAILRGDYDFGSEYVKSAALYKVEPGGDIGSPSTRVVRKRRERGGRGESFMDRYASNPAEQPGVDYFPVLIEYGAVKNTNKNFPNGYVAMFWEDDLPRHTDWSHRHYTEEEALAEAKEMADDAASRFLGDYRVTLQRRVAPYVPRWKNNPATGMTVAEVVGFDWNNIIDPDYASIEVVDTLTGDYIQQIRFSESYFDKYVEKYKRPRYTVQVLDNKSGDIVVDNQGLAGYAPMGIRVMKKNPSRVYEAGSPAVAKRLTDYAREVGFDGVRGTRLTVKPEGGFGHKYIAYTDDGKGFASMFSEAKGRDELDHFASLYARKETPGAGKVYLREGLSGSGHKIWGVQHVSPTGRVHGDDFETKEEALNWIKWAHPEATFVENPCGGLIKKNPEVDQVLVDDLVIFIDNTGSLYGQKSSIEKNLTKRWKKGTYDASKAPKLWGYLAESGAKLYHKEARMSGKWFHTFTPAVRKAAAEQMADAYQGELEVGNYHENPGRQNAFMKPEYAEGTAWEVETNEGSFLVLSDLVSTDGYKEDDIIDKPVDEAAYVTRDDWSSSSVDAAETLRALEDYVDGDIEEATVVKGFFAHLSAPGYMDQTEWAGPFKNITEAKKYIEDQWEVDPVTGESLD